MSKQYDEKVLAEVLKQVNDRGYFVNGVSKRLGFQNKVCTNGSMLSSPSMEIELELEIAVIKLENLRLQAEFRRAQEDRDI